MRVLIIRLSSIGDIILTTPILRQLKEKFPDIVIDFVVLKNFKDSIEGSPYIDNLILFDKKKDDGFRNIKKFGKKLNENRYDYVFDLHRKFRSKLISSEIKSKIFVYPKRKLWKSLLVKLKLIKYHVDDTIIKNYFKAFKVLGIKYKWEDLDFNFSKDDLENVKKYSGMFAMAPGASKETKKWLPEKFGKLAKKLYDLDFNFSKDDLENVKKYSGMFAMAPGASKETKKWLPEKFGKLAKKLYDRYKIKTVLLGGKEDIERCELINKVSENSCINLAGKISLKESGALLSVSKLLVTNDSGPFHIGRGVGCKSYVIFGPTDPNMFEYNNLAELIYANEKCSPCSLHGGKKCPKGHFNCMNNIDENYIFDI